MSGATSLDLSQIRTDALASAATFRTLIGVDIASFATAAQGTLADSALQPSDITSGTITAGTGDIDFDDLGGGVGGSTGATDNRVLRADGTGGSTVQSSPITIDDSGNVTGVGTLAVSTGVNLPNGTYGSPPIVFASAAAIYAASNAVLLKSPNGSLGTFDNTGCFTASKFANGTSGSTTIGNATGGTSHAGPAKLGIYTFATVPTASSYTGYKITISDRAYRSAYSDGTNWRFEADDAVIS